jgi:hypothetical protein
MNNDQILRIVEKTLTEAYQASKRVGFSIRIGKTTRGGADGFAYHEPDGSVHIAIDVRPAAAR